jgi:hypothetical protein
MTAHVTLSMAGSHVRVMSGARRIRQHRTASPFSQEPPIFLARVHHDRPAASTFTGITGTRFHESIASPRSAFEPHQRVEVQRTPLHALMALA